MLILVAFQLCQVDMYRHVLKERHWRKEVAKRYGVLHNCTSVGWRYYRTAWKKRTREEKLVASAFFQPYFILEIISSNYDVTLSTVSYKSAVW